MKIDGIQLREGSNIANLTVATGTAFPSSPSLGELFFRTDVDDQVQGLYLYIRDWIRVASELSLVIPHATEFPNNPTGGQLFYKNTNDGNEGLFFYDVETEDWVVAAAQGLPDVGTPGTYTKVTTDAKGRVAVGSTPTTLAELGVTEVVVRALTAGDGIALNSSNGGTEYQVSLANVSASGTPTFRKHAVDAHGRVTNSAVVAQSDLTDILGPVALSGDATGSGTTSIPVTLATVNSGPGSFGAASQTIFLTVNGKGLVTAATAVPISIDGEQVSSGVLSPGLIPQAGVTQHQSALIIQETQIGDGAIYARVAGTETITGTYAFNNPITIVSPSAGSHAASKQYVDDMIAGLSWKTPVRVATTANITLSGTQTIDGVALVAGNRVLVKNQTTTTQNGVWIVAAGAWTRAADMDSAAETNNAAVFVSDGTTQADTGWVQVNTVASLNGDPIAFVQFNGAAGIIAGAGLTKTGNTIDVVGTAGNIVVNADTIDLAPVSVGAGGTFRKLTVDGFGRVTNLAAVTTADITPLVDSTYVNVTGDLMIGDLTLQSAGTYKGLRILNVAGTGGGSFSAAVTSGGGISLSGDAGPIAFSAGGVERVRFGEGGGVGIGTNVLSGGSGNSTVEGRLIIAGGSSATALFIQGGTDYAGFKIKSGPANANGGNDYYDFTVRPGAGGVGSNADQIAARFESSSATVPNILLQHANSGRVILGATTATGMGSKLDIVTTIAQPPLALKADTSLASGHLAMYDSSATNGHNGYRFIVGASVSSGNPANAFSIFENGIGPKFTLLPGGTTCIGRTTDSSFGLLQVAGGGDFAGGTNTSVNIRAGTGQYVALELAGNGTGIGTTDFTIAHDTTGQALIYQRSNAPMIFATNNTERARFTPTGELTLLRPLVISTGGGMEIGRVDNVASTPYIDFHSGTTGANDFDSRIIASGGTTSSGGGSLQLQATNVALSNNQSVGGRTIYGPNPSWTAYLYVGGDGTNGYTRTESIASIATTNGNLHLDSGTTKTLYFNYYSGSGGFIFGNGAVGNAATLSASGNFVATGDVTAFSDRRVKRDIVTFPNALATVESLRGVRYVRTDDAHEGEAGIGVIAQEVQEVLPELVHTSEDGMLSVAYGNMVAVLIESVKELSAKIKVLETRLEQYEGK